MLPETLLGLSHMASNLHQDDGGSLADTIFISSQQGPLIFRVNKNLSKLDWLAPKIRLKVLPVKAEGIAGYFDG